MYVLIGAVYLAIVDNKNYWGAVASVAPHKNLFIQGNFPGLAFIAFIFWQTGFYFYAALLIVPLLFMRRAMQSVTKAVEEVVNAIDTMVTVIEAKDPYTFHHCDRVALYAMVIAKFCGMPDAFIQKIGRCARLHDVGKILVADNVLKKDGKLSDDEYSHIKEHTDPRKILMDQIPDGIPLKELIELGRHHHERYDGKGYPDRLQGEAIPVEVRVISMADAWDAMTSNRVYRTALTEEKVLSEIAANKGKQWDPLVVEAFLDAHRQGADKAIIENPDILKSPQMSWKITPRQLKYVPASTPEKTEKSSPLFSIFSRRRAVFFGSFVLIILAFLYLFQGSPLYRNGTVFYAALAIFFEFWEMKFPKLPRLCPAESVYLALLFILPLNDVLALIAVGLSLRALYLYGPRVRSSDGYQLFRRLILFALSVPVFKWMGLTQGNRLMIPATYFGGWREPLYLLGMFSAWAILYATLNFFLFHLETMLKRRSFRISLHWPTLKYRIFFQVGLIGPFALILSAFDAVDPIYLPYLIFSFAFLLLLSYPLLDSFRIVVEGNVKTLEALADSADQKFPFYKAHSKRVAALSKNLAISLGMSDQDVEDLERAARVFGLGNIGIRDDVLNKPGALTEEEMEIMKKHVEIAVGITEKYSFYKEEVKIIRNHHERFDGSGYPSGLKGKEIPFGARILGVADCFYAMIAERPYRRALSPDEALSGIQGKSGTRFDPAVIYALTSAYAKGLVPAVRLE